MQGCGRGKLECVVSTRDGSLQLLSGRALHLEQQLHLQGRLCRMATSAVTLQRLPKQRTSALSELMLPGRRERPAPVKAISMAQGPLDGNVLGDSNSVHGHSTKYRDEVKRQLLMQ